MPAVWRPAEPETGHFRRDDVNRRAQEEIRSEVRTPPWMSVTEVRGPAVERWVVLAEPGSRARAKAPWPRASSRRSTRRSARSWPQRLTTTGSPSSRVRPALRWPGASASRFRFLTEGEVRSLPVASAPRYQAAIYLPAYGGLRIGEFAARRIEDVNWERACIHVRRGLTDVRGIIA